MELVIAEKPSVAQSIAAVLGATQRKDGYLDQVHQYRLPRPTSVKSFANFSTTGFI